MNLLLFLFANQIFISAGIAAAAAAAVATASPSIQAKAAKPAKVIFMSEETPTTEMLVMQIPSTLSTRLYSFCNKP